MYFATPPWVVLDQHAWAAAPAKKENCYWIGPCHSSRPLGPIFQGEGKIFSSPPFEVTRAFVAFWHSHVFILFLSPQGKNTKNGTQSLPFLMQRKTFFSHQIDENVFTLEKFGREEPQASQQWGQFSRRMVFWVCMWWKRRRISTLVWFWIFFKESILSSASLGREGRNGTLGEDFGPINLSPGSVGTLFLRSRPTKKSKSSIKYTQR